MQPLRPPNRSIFFFIQRSYKNASNVEKRSTLSGSRRPLSTRPIAERSSLLSPSPRRASLRATEHSKSSISRRFNVVVETPSTAAVVSVGGQSEVALSAPPARSSAEGRGGVTAIEDDLEEVDYDEVDPGSDEEDEEPDFWSKYGVIDAAALDEDAEIEI